MAIRDRINIEIRQLVQERLATWQKQRQEILLSVTNATAKVAELDEAIAEAQAELQARAGR